MTIVGQVEPLPGIPPTAKHLTQLSEIIRQTGARVVVRDPFQSDAALDFLSRETGIRSMVLSTMCSAPTGRSYLEHFEQIADVLASSASEARGSGEPR
jgi:zinc/manganese transport system substrate-binding protein